MGIDGHFALQRGTQQEGGKPPEEIKLQLQRVDADVYKRQRSTPEKRDLSKLCVHCPLATFLTGILT